MMWTILRIRVEELASIALTVCRCGDGANGLSILDTTTLHSKFKTRILFNVYHRGGEVEET